MPLVLIRSGDVFYAAHIRTWDFWNTPENSEQSRQSMGGPTSCRIYSYSHAYLSGVDWHASLSCRQAANLYLAGEGVREEETEKKNREGDEALPSSLGLYGDPAPRRGWQFEGCEGSEPGGMGSVHRSSKQRRATCEFPFLSLLPLALFFSSCSDSVQFSELYNESLLMFWVLNSQSFRFGPFFIPVSSCARMIVDVYYHKAIAFVRL
jgi:hypothetical protein